MYEVTVTATISASHHLRGYQGKCEQVHGHNYRVEATVTTDRLDETGLAVDFGVLREHLNRVVERFDHQDLNQTESFRDQNPSSENLARVVFQGLRDSMRHVAAKVVRVRVYETEGSCVTYSKRLDEHS